MTSLFNERHTTHKCLRCAHVWTGRESFQGSQELPKRCASCRSPLWNVPRRKKAGKPINALALLEEWREAGLDIRLHVGARYRHTDEAKRVSLYVGELASWWGATVEECVLACADEVRSGMASVSQK
jgi:hypothetical protein